MTVKRADVENGAKSVFEPNSTPSTSDVLGVITKLERGLPGFDRTAILAPALQEGTELTPALTRLDTFTARLQ